ncbi:penicillin-binding transpeptidase domain-containing protein [uncultured Jatrophihabitans sp.]|uniref:penicillin-binding transpeptidase domain-containing protein n=1 Tax=uncultured Jatrophihabitans sp. TaxID=1610747 RepID=UPI0035CB474A
MTRRVVAAAVIGLLLAGLLSACTGSSGPSAQQRAAQRWLDAVGAGRVDTAARATNDPTSTRSVLTASRAGLGSTAKGSFTVGTVRTKGTKATAAYAASWAFPGVAQRWRYRGSLTLRHVAKAWRVQWSPEDLNPVLLAGQHLALRRTQPTRAALQDSAGRALFAPTPVVAVGLEPKLVRDLPRLAKQLAAVPSLQTTAAEITAAVKAAAPTDFVPVITLRRPAYLAIKTKIYDLPGTVFHSETRVLAPTARFGQPLLGTVGDATAAQIAASKGRLAAGDQAGQGGLQQAFDSTLTGTAGVAVVAAPDTGSAPSSFPRVLATLALPQPGKPVRLTLDRTVQTAAEKALATTTPAASVVVVSRSTGRILADADTAAATYDYGLQGAFPPGSTFKTVTYSAAFATTPSLTPSTTVRCPATVTVDGRRFENENRFSYPPIPLRNAFGYSCNTTAITTARSLPPSALPTAAASLGLGARWTLPVKAFSGSLPTPAGATEQAADAIGQGRVLVSPLLMALVAGNASTGRPVLPSLVAGAATPATPAGTALPAARTSALNSLMRATVDLPQGTGHDLATIGGVEGKTGTAEYGTDTPPKSHSWFAGVKGDYAFAVFVYGGDTAKVKATPIAKALLRSLT